jgi:hypothetical protein
MHANAQTCIFACGKGVVAGGCVSGEWRRLNFAFSHGYLARALLENHEPASVLRRASAMLRTDRQSTPRAHACVRARCHTASDGWLLNIRTEYCCRPAYRKYVSRLPPVLTATPAVSFHKSLSRTTKYPTGIL